MSVPSASLQPYTCQAGEHERLAYTGGSELAIILDASITGGQLTVIDPKAGPHDRGHRPDSSTAPAVNTGPRCSR